MPNEDIDADPSEFADTGFSIQAFIDLYISLRRRHFTDEIASKALEELKSADLDFAAMTDELKFGIFSAPFNVYAQSWRYRFYGLGAETEYTAEQEMLRIEHLAVLIYKVLEKKVLNKSASDIHWKNPSFSILS